MQCANQICLSRPDSFHIPMDYNAGRRKEEKELRVLQMSQWSLSLCEQGGVERTGSQMWAQPSESPGGGGTHKAACQEEVGNE